MVIKKIVLSVSKLRSGTVKKGGYTPVGGSDGCIYKYSGGKVGLVMHSK
jgi:hypothetical protein